MAKIKAIVAVPEVGEVYDGIVKSIMPYGAFVEFMPGKDGLLHVTELDWKRVENVEDVLKGGDQVRVKLIGIDKQTGKFKLSHKVLIPKPEGYVEPANKMRNSAVHHSNGPRTNNAPRHSADRNKMNPMQNNIRRDSDRY